MYVSVDNSKKSHFRFCSLIHVSNFILNRWWWGSRRDLIKACDRYRMLSRWVWMHINCLISIKLNLIPIPWNRWAVVNDDIHHISSAWLLSYPVNIDHRSTQHHLWWCSGTYSGLPCRRSRVRFPYPPILEKCATGICLCNLLRSTQPNDRETVIEG